MEEKFKAIIEAGYFKFGHRVYKVDKAATIGNISNILVPHVVIGTFGGKTIKADIRQCAAYIDVADPDPEPEHEEELITTFNNVADGFDENDDLAVVTPPDPEPEQIIRDIKKPKTKKR